MTTFTKRGQHGTYVVESAPISKGGVGSIHRTNDPDRVYKQYFVPAKAPNRSHLDRLISIGRDVLVRDGRKPGDTPESSVNWPLDVIGGSTGVQGVLLPTIPPPLFNEFGVRGLEFLVMARGNPPSAKGRIALLLRMAEILHFVDSRGLIHGDINGKNLAWTLSPAPVMYLIDCDGMVPQKPPPTEGVQAMGWVDPRVMDGLIPAHDQYSDWYALALAMYRGLLLTPGKLDSRQADGSWPKPKAIPADLHATIATLLRRSLSNPLNPHSRPRPAEWVQGLIEAFLENGRFNDVATQKLDDLSAAPAPAKPTFTSLPSTNWTQFLPKPSPPQPPSNPPAPPQWPHPTQQNFLPPLTPQSTQNYPTQQNFLPPPVPQPTQNYQRPTTTQIGGLAAKALDGGMRWHVRGLLCSLFLSPVAVVYIAVALYQLRGVSGHPQAALRRKTLYIYGVIAVIVMLSYSIH
jgi:hypothetical protein